MTYVISNIHGNYQKFQSLLSQISFRERDTLYLLGDLLDYGEESMELIADVSVRLNVFPIAGEHDFLAARMLKGFLKMTASGTRPDPEFLTEMTQWVQDGGQATLDAFRALDEEEREGVIEYLEEMTLFEEVEVKGKKYVLVHAGVADYTDGDDLGDYLPDDFFSELGKKAFSKVMELEETGGFSFTLLGEYFNPDEMGRLQGMMQRRRALAENGTAVLRASIDTLRAQKQQSDAKQSGDTVQSIKQLLDAKKKKTQ